MRMRPSADSLPRGILALIVAIMGLTLAAPAPAAGQSPVTATADVNVLSKYFFAGIPFAMGEVSQAQLTVVTPGGVTLYALGVYDYDRSEVTELDVWGDFYRQLAPTVGLFVGAALYNFDFVTSWESTPEVYGGLVFTAPLNPTLYVAHDFDLGEGTHATLILSQSAPLGESGATLNVSGNLDYNDDYYVDYSGFSYADVGASVSIPAGPVTLTPSATLLFLLDEDFEAQAELAGGMALESVEPVFGLSASFTF